MWRVQPKVDARRQQLAKHQIVVGEINDRDVRSDLRLRSEDSFDYLLPGLVAGMRFAGVDDLQWSGGGGDALQASTS
jgi:hypothetical protein